ncbi:phosphate ABC transporter permease subunit PstC [Candidatus Poribacteria bacterium]|nr:phosphate ABC transporter permease subunit PstC [Candidatus Poribacteria bacterium]
MKINRNIKDKIAHRIMFTFSLFILSLAFIIAFGLYLKAKPILDIKSFTELLFSIEWHPTQGKFGLGSFIIGTIWVTGIALIIAVPLSIFTGIYLSEYTSKRLRSIIKPLIDVLSGISPIIYGVWGILVIIPLVRDYLMPFFSEHLPFFPFISDNYTGYSVLAGGIVLAIMISPLIISIIEEIIRTIPFEAREASLALGATKWQTIKHVVLKKALPGIVAAIILGLSRAFGETIAVLMVSGCSLNILPKSIFDSAYPLPAFIANTFGEMMSIPLYDSAVLLCAFILLIVTVLFNMIGWWILLRNKTH